MTASFASFGLLLFFRFRGQLCDHCHARCSVLDALFAPIHRLFRSKCLSYSAPIFMYTSVTAIFVVLAGDHAAFLRVYNDFFAAAPFLGMDVNNATWPSGAYIAEGTATAFTQLQSPILTALFVSWAASLAYSTMRRCVKLRRVFLSTEWCMTNSFLSHVAPPTFLTTLPLEQTSAIRIGNRMFCKPSTMALLGYATVLNEKASIASKKGDDEYSVVSIYSLVMALYAPRWCISPSTVGAIVSNAFQARVDPLDKTKKHVYTRGTCVS
ncbi:hypothetical protein ACHHYP_16642 [Achlya hypogyna]|uniref:Secreted protein n=1 Tax=Achlya hypogyna TaxID=1202772 RepID=A0A1V9Y678_ACHHY|nr:hypothetical protein ACHHYP_16642 [Achlya hypogyna]